MRPNFVALLILLFATQIISQQEEFQKLIENKLNTRQVTTKKVLDDIYFVIESINQEWINSAWKNVNRSTYYYDSSNTCYLTTIETWDNTGWISKSQYWSTYNENGDVLEEIYKIWIDPNWVNSERYLYEYDQNENTISETSQIWNSIDWENSDRKVYSYINNNLTEKLYQQWNNTNWLDVDRYQYTYVNNNLTEELFQQYITGWNNVELIQNSYDNQNNIIETLNNRWDNGSWFVEMRFTNQYSNGNLTVETLQEGWIDTLWMNIGLYTKQLNNRGSIVEYTSRYWDSLIGWINQQHWILTYLPDNRLKEWVTQFWQLTYWENFSRLNSTYDSNGNETIFAWEMWENSAWQNHIQILYNYTSVSTAEEDILKVLSYSLSQNYPNPFNPGTTISWHLPVNSWQTIKLFDALGREIETIVDGYFEAGIHSIFYIVHSTLPSGIYFYQLKAGNYLFTKKMVLLK